MFTCHDKSNVNKKKRENSGRGEKKERRFDKSAIGEKKKS